MQHKPIYFQKFIIWPSIGHRVWCQATYALVMINATLTSAPTTSKNPRNFLPLFAHNFMSKWLQNNQNLSGFSKFFLQKITARGTSGFENQNGNSSKEIENETSLMQSFQSKSGCSECKMTYDLSDGVSPTKYALILMFFISKKSENHAA